jgi:hypothetical protein
MKKKLLQITALGIVLILAVQFSAFAQHIDTVTTLQNQKSKFVILKVANNKHYKMERVPPSQISHTESEETATKGIEKTTAPSAKTSPFFPSATECSGERFAGKDRAVTKTHLNGAQKKTFATVDALFASGLLTSDNQMRNLTPPISKDPNSARVGNEKKEVEITKAFLYGIYKEKDNDFHVIIGNGKSGSQMKLLNIEIAALPDVGTTLQGPRDEIINKFGDLNCGDGAFKPVGTLIPIKVEGSLFYDIDHAPGLVGFGAFKPKTAWEIHPVKSIQFLNN